MAKKSKSKVKAAKPERLPTAPPATRSLNPDALAAMQQLAAPEFLRAYELLYQHGPMTGSELKAKLPINASTEKARMNLHAFLHPMFAKYGVLAKVARRRCTVTNVSSTVWDVTVRVPKQPVKWPSHRANVAQKAMTKGKAPFLKDMSPDVVARCCEELHNLLGRIVHLRTTPILLGVDYDACVKIVNALQAEAEARAIVAAAPAPVATATDSDAAPAP
jgi:hypothetical protein